MKEVRVTMAGIGPVEFANHAQNMGLSGTVFASLGFGSWGVEEGVTAFFGIEDNTNSLAKLAYVVSWILAHKEQESAYVVGAEPEPVFWYAKVKQTGRRNGRGGYKAQAPVLGGLR